MNEFEGSDTSDENSRIIVDESWKEQVEKEKEQLRAEQEKSGSGADSQTSAELPIPEASFSVLVSALGSQAMAALGLLVDPQTGQPAADRLMAKHFIDLLGTLEEKTRGNLDSDENQLLQESLHQLRMLYVATANPSSDTGGNRNDKHPNPSSPIIQLP